MKFVVVILIICVISNKMYTQEYKKCTISEGEYVRLGKLLWQTKNCDCNLYRNGDTIYYAKTIEEWLDYIQSEKPAWCYFNFDEKFSHLGKLYNVYVLRDSQSVCPDGWRIIGPEDGFALWDLLKDSLILCEGEWVSVNTIKINTPGAWYVDTCVIYTNELGLSFKPTGVFWGKILEKKPLSAHYWIYSDDKKIYGFISVSACCYRSIPLTKDIDPSIVKLGLSIRCVKNAE